MLAERTTTIVVLVTTLGWAANLGASIAPWLDYQSDPMVHTAFMAVVGAELGLDAWRRRINRESDQS